MLNKIRAIVFVFTILGATMTGNAKADRIAVKLTESDIKTITPADQSLGSYYVAKIDLPLEIVGKELLGGILEVAVDVGARNVGDYTNEAPMLEVYALTGDLGETLDPSKFKTPSPARRNVVAGSNRNVRINITEIVKDFIRNPSSNHGIVFGSLTNTRDGYFDLKASGGALATITYLYTAKQ